VSNGDRTRIIDSAANAAIEGITSLLM